MVFKTRGTVKNFKNMIYIPENNNYTFFTNGNIIEENNEWSGFQFQWDETPKRIHNKTIAIKSFYIDKHPVTCREYYKYLKESTYFPFNTHNYLKNWIKIFNKYY